MIPCTDLFKESSRYGRGLVVTADIMRGDSVVLPGVPVSTVGWTADRSSNTRLTADLTLLMSPADENSVVNVETTRIRLAMGITSLGYRETIDVGTFRVDEMSRDSRASLSVNTSGLEAYVIDARFLSPRTPPYGASTVQTIIDLITEVMPTARVLAENSRNKRVEMRAPWERERWEVIADLAASIDAEVFADYRGVFVIRDIQTIAQAPVYRMNMGEDGVVLQTRAKRTRDRRYNAAVVSGTSSDPDVPPVFAVAIDSDPMSPTYFYGDYGQVPRFYSSQFFTTVAQCQAVADDQILEAKTANRTVDFTAPMMPFLETGDCVLLDTIDLTTEQHMFGKITANLDAAGGVAEMSVETVNSKRAEEALTDAAEA